MDPTTKDPRELSRAKEYIWGTSRPARYSDLSPRLTDLENEYLPRPVIVFIKAESLFPDVPSDMQLDRVDDLNYFLEEVLIPPAPVLVTALRISFFFPIRISNLSLSCLSLGLMARVLITVDPPKQFSTLANFRTSCLNGHPNFAPSLDEMKHMRFM